MAFVAFATAEDAIGFRINLAFLGFGHAPSLDGLRRAGLRVTGVRFVRHGIGALARLSERGGGKFLAFFGGQSRHEKPTAASPVDAGSSSAK